MAVGPGAEDDDLLDLGERELLTDYDLRTEAELEQLGQGRGRRMGGVGADKAVAAVGATWNGRVPAFRTRSNKRLKPSGSRPKTRTKPSSLAAIKYPNNMWNSCCSLVQRVPDDGRRRAVGHA